MAIIRDENGRLVVRRRPGKRTTGEATEATEPSVEEAATASPQRYDRIGRRIVRNEAALCTARKVDGTPCGAYAVAGSKVCRVHGGSAPQVIRNARVRLGMHQDWLLTELLKVIKLTEDERLKVTAIFGAMDRGGLHAKSATEVAGEVTLKGFEETVSRAVRMRRPGDETGPRVIDHQVIEPVRRAAQPGDEPAPIEYPLSNPAQRSQEDRYTDDESVDLPEVTSRPPSYPPAVHRVAPEDETANGPGRAAHGFHDVVEGTAGAKAMLRQANARSGVPNRRPTRTEWRP